MLVKKVKHLKSGEYLAENCYVACQFWQRFRGWMFKTSVEDNEALMIKPCQQIHMFFMRVCIDVIFITNRGLICGIERSIKPWTLSKRYKEANYAVEFKEGAIGKFVGIGDQIELL